tara:strand:- start:899 stop:1663 length:765 start_codon:yes stop_codon:yes gene_type:complete
MITVVVPIFNEQDNIKPLLDEITQAAKLVPISEIIYVDDASTDNTYDTLTALRDDFPALRILKHQKNAGQSAALWTGVKNAGNDIVVTLDGDGQNNPADIPLLYAKYENEKAATPQIMVMGERTKRNDSWIKRKSSKFANRIRAALLKDNTRDTGCSLKLFKRRDYLNLPYFNHMHRFLPALMMRDGIKTIHVGVSHRPRVSGVSKYGTLDRLAAGIVDLWGVFWLMKRGRRTFETTEIIDAEEFDNVHIANFT